ncbi:MAG: hypothetical protein COA45_02550 [Zetaproteobacteria bacterium]|nr:MAG: hypothetical protein COA45_02550 [Zetaproteobacteria bacterium]
MKYSKFIITATILSSILCMSSAHASKRLAVSGSGQTCTMVENATLSVSFSNVPIELKNTQTYIEGKADEIMLVAKDLNIEKMHVNNINYNVYTTNSGGCNANTPSKYSLNGGVSFKIEDTEKAAALMEAIGEKGYQVNFSMNGYRQCQ